MKRTYEKKSPQLITSVKPTTLNLQPRGFAPPQAELAEDVSSQTNKASSENLLEKLISTPTSESSTAPIQRKPQNRLKAIASQRMAIQAKLNIGEPNDKYEKEADDTASKVVQQINSSPQDSSVQKQESMEEDEELQMKSISSIQRDESIEEEDEELQMKSLVQRRENISGGEASEDLESSIQSSRGSGQSLDTNLQALMSEAMGGDFSGVKVHTDSQSDQLNKSIQAKAFTTGQDVFFRQGEYNPISKGGQELIAHELTHVVQQTGKHSVGTIQRLPTRKDVTKQVGEPRESSKKSLKYKSFLGTLDSYNSSVSRTIASDAQGIADQKTLILQSLENVIQASLTYNQKHFKDERSKLVATIRKQAILEKVVVRTRANYFTNNLLIKKPMWFQVLPKDMGTQVKELTNKTQVGTDAGGVNTVAEHQLDSDYSGYFKEDKAEITSEAETNQAIDMGIPMQDPKFAYRSVAMYRIDQLLGGNIIARTEFATQKKHKGTISAKAKGTKMGDLRKQGGVDMDDPVLQRSLSKLDMIDAICFQIDRHEGNLYIQTNINGDVTGVTGIDNDMAFPSKDTKTDKFKKVTTKLESFAGVSRYFDKEMAEMILALDENDLASVLNGLLSNAEIDFTVERLRDLKSKITTAKQNGDLLNPNQWNAVTALAQKTQGSGYVADKTM